MAKKTKRVGTIAPNLDEHVVPVGSLSADPANARLHDERSLDAIKGSLRRFGQQKPVIVDKGGVVIAGNGTLEAARQLGWTHIAAVRSDLAGVDRTAYAIADNRTAELSSWDADVLRKVMAALPADAAMATGYSSEELEHLLRTDVDEPTTEHAPPDPQVPAVTRAGDMWILGEHRLLCGDSTDDTDVERVMEGHKAALVSTDPPYLVEYTGVRAGGRGKDWSATYRETEIHDATAFFRAVFAGIVGVLAPNAPIYCWHASKRIAEILRVWAELGILDHQHIVWVKPCPVFGSVFWHFRHEPCLMGWVQGSKPTHDGRHDHSSVWTAAGLEIPLEKLTKPQLIQLIKDASSVWEVNWEGQSRPVGNEHPTQKPIELFARPMRKHTRAGDHVYEPFSGSGSQIIAAEQLGRRCHAIELEPVFVDVAIRRWQAFTGRAASLAGDGRTWSDIAAERTVAVEEPCHVDQPTHATTPAAVG